MAKKYSVTILVTDTTDTKTVLDIIQAVAASSSVEVVITAIGCTLKEEIETVPAPQ